MEGVKHPATYTDTFLPLFAKILNEYRAGNVLDPMAGSGKIGLVKEHGWNGYVVANELEPEWRNGYPVDEWHFGDAAEMNWAIDRRFDALIVSPVYGNRMSDTYDGRDGSKRITYRVRLGRPLSPGNAGQMQWSEDYRAKHREIWRECVRVLRRGAVMAVNASNHIRDGVEIDVVGWHRDELARQGLTYVTQIDVPTPRMGFGANRNLRVKCESILVFTNN